MITFEQVGDGTPKDIQVTTDDSDGELATMSDAFDESDAQSMQAAINLAACRNGPPFVFIIPGEEAGEVGELFMDEIPLAEYLDDLMRKMMEEAEASSE